MITGRHVDSRAAAGASALLERLLADVKLRAYQIHRDRVASGVPGDALTDWKSAEQAVLTAAGLLGPDYGADVPQGAEQALQRETTAEASGEAALAEAEMAIAGEARRPPPPGVSGPERPMAPVAPPVGLTSIEHLAAAMASLTARDVMRGRVTPVGPECTLAQLARTLDERCITAVPVVDRDHRLLGVATVSDLVHGAALAQQSAARIAGGSSLGDPALDASRAAGQMLANVRVGDVCSRGLVAAPPDASLLELGTLMAGHRVQQVLIIEDGCIVGLVTALDLMCALYGRFPKEAQYTVR